MPPLCAIDRPQVPGVIDPLESNYSARLPSGPKSATLSHERLPLGISDVLFSEVPSEPEPTTPMLRDDHWAYSADGSLHSVSTKPFVCLFSCGLPRSLFVLPVISSPNRPSPAQETPRLLRFIHASHHSDYRNGAFRA